jgi:hypothetical protein
MKHADDSAGNGQPIDLGDRQSQLQHFLFNARELLSMIHERLDLFGQDIPWEERGKKAEHLNNAICEWGPMAHRAARYLELPSDPTPLVIYVRDDDDGINRALDSAFVTLVALIGDAEAESLRLKTKETTLRMPAQYFGIEQPESVGQWSKLYPLKMLAKALTGKEDTRQMEVIYGPTGLKQKTPARWKIRIDTLSTHARVAIQSLDKKSAGKNGSE